MTGTLTIRMVIFMKKWIKLLMAFLLAYSAAACSKEQGASSAQLQEGVTLSMVDVLEVDNKSANTVFFYFLAGVDNNSDSVYHMSNLVYSLRAKNSNDFKTINPIDQFKTIVTNDVQPGLSTYIYGYIGVPKTSDRNLGLYIEKDDTFLPFSSTSIRKIDDSKIKNSDEKKFTIYEDEYYEFDVDASQLSYRYENGKSIIEGLKINYRNKTDQRLVVPYLSPICTIDGYDFSGMANADELRAMSQEQIEQYAFTDKGLPAKTESIRAQAYGYELFYLGPQQEVSASILFEAPDSVPDFASKLHNGITVNINSPSLGYRQILKVDY